jgi:hypothetical protein
MNVGDQVAAPPAGNATARDWVEATVVEIGRARTIRDPSDGSTSRFQKVHVRYGDGPTAAWDMNFLLRRQPSTNVSETR